MPVLIAPSKDGELNNNFLTTGDYAVKKICKTMWCLTFLYTIRDQKSRSSAFQEVSDRWVSAPAEHTGPSFDVPLEYPMKTAPSANMSPAATITAPSMALFLSKRMNWSSMSFALPNNLSSLEKGICGLCIRAITSVMTSPYPEGLCQWKLRIPPWLQRWIPWL